MRANKLFWVPALAVGLVAGGCTAEQTEEGDLPNVEVEGGNMPEYDVDAADVDVTTDTQQVVTPDIDVNPPSNN
ncbi:MAG TPA: hypothetical protein VHG51_20115 [Longimicrobiaceae bacterium]|nr:hypothetical protein [Longimicrobiaceae bacterium]